MSRPCTSRSASSTSGVASRRPPRQPALSENLGREGLIN
jgi:hypothetical protein